MMVGSWVGSTRTVTGEVAVGCGGTVGASSNPTVGSDGGGVFSQAVGTSVAWAVGLLGNEQETRIVANSSMTITARRMMLFFFTDASWF